MLHPHTKRILELYLDDPKAQLMEKDPTEWLHCFGGLYKRKEDRDDAMRIYEGLVNREDKMGWVEHVLRVERIKQI